MNSKPISIMLWNAANISTKFHEFSNFILEHDIDIALITKTHANARKDRCRKFITTDEAWIYLSDTNAKSKVQYLSRGQIRRDLTPSTTVPHPKGVMVWMGISTHGVTKPRFVKPGAKINSEYYLQKILKPVLKDDYCRLYPNGVAVSHQDSAQSHASKVTQKFLTDQQVQFLRPEQWIPNSPDAAPSDYFL
ncbi:histone-lysine N-methyltransferase SETMAR-like [Parasteatoda tepidariorum]|uniref:histone-lysine N-methyltransferase SETMAR-like n=1 Tax=Parasteatoda tepidariorum TaxID=114398 RepID=UPI001C7296CA|nr:uncharacterized protein LOC122269965 [Parasteatoda tepidariorum]